MDQLRDDEVGDVVVDRGAEKDHALVEQPAEDVERALAAARLFDDERYKWCHVLTLFCVDAVSACVPMAETSVVGHRVRGVGRVFGGGLVGLGHRDRDGRVGDEIDGLGQ